MRKKQSSKLENSNTTNKREENTGQLAEATAEQIAELLWQTLGYIRKNKKTKP